IAADQITKEHGLGPAEPDFETLQGIALKAGLELGKCRLTETDLAALAETLPAVVQLKNGNAMLLLALSRGPDGISAKLYDPMVGAATPLVVEIDRLRA